MHVHFISRPSYAYNITSGTSSGVSPRPIPFGIKTVRLVASVDSWIAVGPGTPVASNSAGQTGSIFLPAGTVEWMMVDSNDVIAVMADGTAGQLNIAELSR